MESPIWNGIYICPFIKISPCFNSRQQVETENYVQTHRNCDHPLIVIWKVFFEELTVNIV